MAQVRKATQKVATSAIVIADVEGMASPLLKRTTTKAGEEMFAILSANGANFGKRGTNVSKRSLLAFDVETVDVWQVIGGDDRSPVVGDEPLAEIPVDVMANGSRQAHGNVTIDGEPWHVWFHWSPSGHVTGGCMAGVENDRPADTGRQATVRRIVRGS